jgi:hypothetical protein
MREKVRRNALQDLALLKTRPAGKQDVLDLVGRTEKDWCKDPASAIGRKEYGAEWYLKLRDLILTTGPQP